MTHDCIVNVEQRRECIPCSYIYTIEHVSVDCKCSWLPKCILHNKRHRSYRYTLWFLMKIHMD